MRIGINTLFLIPGKVGGTETYTRGLIGVLEKIDKKNDYRVFCNQENDNTFEFKSKNFRKVFCPIRASFRPLRILYEQLILPFQVWQQGIDVLLSLGYICPLFVSSQLIVAIYDLNWFFHPQEFSFLQRLGWRILVSLSAKRADQIITSSENSKKDMASILNIPKSKISVVYGGVDRFRFNPSKNKKGIMAIKRKYGLKDKFILAVAASYRFKNLGKLIDAFSLVSKKLNNFQLLIVGLSGKAESEILAKIKKYNLDKKVIIAGWVPDEDLPFLYSAAAVYIHPSLYEGFGFPVLEAMACGCPVVSSKNASLPELVGEAGILTDTTQKENIVKAVKVLFQHSLLRKSLRIKGLKRSRKFSWEKAGRKILKAYEKIEKG